MRRLCAVLLVVGMMSGCSPWKVVRQARPNPLANQREFAVAPGDFSRIDNRAQIAPVCIEPKVPKDCFEALEDEFLDALKVGETLEITPLDTTSAPFVIRTQVLKFDPGEMSAKAKRSSRAVMLVRIEHRDGRVIDEVRLTTGTKPVAAEPAPGPRVWLDGAVLGEKLRSYLLKRAELANSY